RHVCRRAGWRLCATRQRRRLGVWPAEARVEPLADHPAILHDHAPNHRVGLDRAAPVHRQADRAAEQGFIARFVHFTAMAHVLLWLADHINKGAPGMLIPATSRKIVASLIVLSLVVVAFECARATQDQSSQDRVSQNRATAPRSTAP